MTTTATNVGTFAICNTNAQWLRGLFLNFTDLAASTDVTVEVWNATGTKLYVSPTTVTIQEGLVTGSGSCLLLINIVYPGDSKLLLRATLASGTATLSSAYLTMTE